MKKEYLTPDVRIAYVGFEVNFLASGLSTGGATGEDLDDPDPFEAGALLAAAYPGPNRPIL